MRRGRLAIPLAVGRPPWSVARGRRVLLLRPRGGVIDPGPGGRRIVLQRRARSTGAGLPRPAARARRSGSLAVEVGVLIWLVARPPRALLAPRRRPLVARGGRGRRRVARAGGRAAAAAAVARERAKRRRAGHPVAGGGWAGDLAKSWAIGAAIGGAGAAAGIALVRRLPRGWWLPGAGVVVALRRRHGVRRRRSCSTRCSTVRRRSPPGRDARRRAGARARAGVDVGEVSSWTPAGGRRRPTPTSPASGHTKRVVLYDKLARRLHAATRSGWSSPTSSPTSTTATSRAGCSFARCSSRRAGCSPRRSWLRRLARRRAGRAATRARRSRWPSALVVPPVTLGLQPALAPVEARADSYALRLTERRRGRSSRFERRIAVRNVARSRSAGLARRRCSATHPPTIERIGIGEASRRARGRRRLGRQSSRPPAASASPRPNSGRFLMPSRVRHLE